MFEKLSPETRRSYSNKVAFAQSIVGAKDFAAMVRSPTAFAKLRAHYPSDGTLRATLTAILAGIRETRPSSPRLVAWRARHAEVSRAAAAKHTGVITAEQGRKYVCWRTIVAAAGRQTSHATLDESQRTVLLAMLTEMTPKRSDYGELRVVAGEDAGKGNHVVVRRGGADLVLAEYKTAKAFGTHTERLPRGAYARLRASLKAWPRKHVFVGADGGPMTPSAFGGFVKRAMLAAVGKPVGPTMLRHIYISDVVRHRPEAERGAAARSMLHSDKEQAEYVLTRAGGRPVCGGGA